jgi:hypothetical protein
MTTEQSTPSPNHHNTSRPELISMIVTGVLVVASIVVAIQTYGKQPPIVFAFAVGALGGLIHEVAQSGGKIMFFERKLDGMYLGTLSGMVLGAVAGVLAARGLQGSEATNLFYECLLAGMALTGVVEASTGAPLPPGQQTVTAPQAAKAEALLKEGADGSDRPLTRSAVPPALTPPPAQLPGHL